MAQRKAGGYVWNERITSAEEAHDDAIQHLSALRHITRSPAVTEHLLNIAFDLAEMQTALRDLRDIER